MPSTLGAVDAAGYRVKYLLSGLFRARRRPAIG
jgi:hypothetical protein